MWIWISLYFNLIILIALSSRESEFQNLYVSSEKKIENVYLCQFWNKFDSSILTMYVCTLYLHAYFQMYFNLLFPAKHHTNELKY